MKTLWENGTNNASLSQNKISEKYELPTSPLSSPTILRKEYWILGAMQNLLYPRPEQIWKILNVNLKASPA